MAVMDSSIGSVSPDRPASSAMRTLPLLGRLLRDAVAFLALLALALSPIALRLWLLLR